MSGSQTCKSPLPSHNTYTAAQRLPLREFYLSRQTRTSHKPESCVCSETLHAWNDCSGSGDGGRKSLRSVEFETGGPDVCHLREVWTQRRRWTWVTLTTAVFASSLGRIFLCGTIGAIANESKNCVWWTQEQHLCRPYTGVTDFFSEIVN